jgi:hypothetical protein
VVAATLLGCVMAIEAPGPVHPVSYKYCGNSTVTVTTFGRKYELTFRNLSVHTQLLLDSSLQGIIEISLFVS